MINLDKPIHIIEERDDLSRYEEAKTLLLQALKDLDDNNLEEKGTCCYYLLRATLKSHVHFETEEAKKYYDQMFESFTFNEKKLLKELRELNEKSEEYSQKQGEIESFYNLMERDFSTLEVIYDKKDFLEAKNRTFEEKMRFRGKAYWFRSKYWNWCEYTFLKGTCLYGNSFGRWGLTSVIFSLFFGILYYILGPDLALHGEVLSTNVFINSLYYSVVTFTSLGFGDIVPITLLAKVLTGIEVFLGYIMLGMFISLLQKKL